MKSMLKRAAMTVAITVGLVLAPSAALAAPGGAGPADGRCVAAGAGAAFDGATKSSVARAGLMSFVILDHAFNGADATEALLNISICD